MEHDTTVYLNSILILLVLSVGAVALFRVFKMPPILGYLLVGILAGEHALGWIPHNESIEFMGEVGVVFLLFAIGLEFSIKQLIAMKTTVLGLGGLQVILTTAIAGVIHHYFGMSWQGAIIVGGAAAMSSTAIVVKQLTEQDEMRSSHGRLALSILLFQDIAVIPFLVAIPILAGDGQIENNFAFWMDVLAGAGIFVLMLVFGRFALRPIFHLVARSNSLELFNISVLLVALTAAWVTESVGLSLALGAFLAGMMLSETEYKHQIEAEIRPFRDILMGLFFITVGTRLDLFALPDIWLSVLLLVFGLIVVKGVMIILLTRLFEADIGISTRTGLVLAQGGEFGFALLTLALGDRLLTPEESQSMLTAIVISMAVSPLIIKYNGKITRLFFKDTSLKQRYQEAHRFSLALKGVEDHVIICGYRHVGQNLGKFLKEQGINFVALELDPGIIKEAWEAGEPVYYGDATRPEILIAAGLYRARLLVVVATDIEIAKRITEVARKKEKDVPILVRTRDDLYMNELLKIGATDVVPETLEATMTVAEKTLRTLGVSSEEVSRVIEKVRESRYESLRSYFRGEKIKKNVEEDTTPQLHTITLKEHDYAVGKRIDELYLGRYDAMITALRRGRFQGEKPEIETVLQRGDALIIEMPNNNYPEIEQYLRHAAKGNI